MARPTDFPEWATDDVVDPVSGKANVIEPAEEAAGVEDKTEGFKRGGGSIFPKRQSLNWLFRTINAWINYFDEERATFLVKTANLVDVADRAASLRNLRLQGYGDFAVTPKVPPSMKVSVAPGYLVPTGYAGVADRVVRYVGGQDTPTLVAPSAGNSRYDIVAINSTLGTIGVIPGVAAPAPAVPRLPAFYAPLALLTMTAGMVTITEANITDIRYAGIPLGHVDPTNYAVKAKNSGLNFTPTGVETSVGVQATALFEGQYLVLSHANYQYTSTGLLQGMRFGLLKNGVHFLLTGGLLSNVAGQYNYEHNMEPTLVDLVPGDDIAISVEISGAPTNPKVFDASVTLIRVGPAA